MNEGDMRDRIMREEQLALKHEQIVTRLLNKVYDYVALLDLHKNTLYIDFDQVSEQWDWTNEEHDYDAARFSLTDHFILPEDCETFIRNSDRENLIRQLEERDEYIFTSHFLQPDGTKRLKMFHYYYYDREQGLVIASMEDKTSLLYQDPLTGEFTRRGFIENAEEILRDEQRTEEFAILYFNLKGFKAINDLFGAEGGDRALRWIPRLLRQSGLHPIVIGRLNADHFACLVEQKNIHEEELMDLLHLTYEANNRSLDLYAVCCIIHISDEDRHGSVGNMCGAARMALSFIEDEYVKPYIVFDETMRTHYMERTRTAAELGAALENEEFKVYYQPVYDVKTGQIASAEALVRWQRGDGNMVSPGVFVPVLEENGRISQMDLLVERSVINFLEKRHAQNQPIVPISMNMSQMDFYDKDMMASVLLDVSNTTLPLDFTRFEVTETAYSTVAENNRNALLDMKRIGVKFYLDDFGSGYSSFSTIRDFDFDVIKLDMGFVQKIGTSIKADGVIWSIIAMAHTIGTKVVAEGAETQEQVDFLTDCGCDYIQGYYYSKPLPEHEFAELLNQTA